MSSLPPTSILLIAILLLIVYTPTAHAFGAGNIASTAAPGKNWRHGDIADTLLTALLARSAGGGKFTRMDIKRVYFGNWLRDYSQAMDVGALKMVGPNILRTLVWILSFMTFGFATGEFEVTVERLGVYRPEEHIDNPKDYADNLDARTYDKRLRGPIDAAIELTVDDRTGMKNYIANERLGISSSAGMVRKVLGQCIELGRRYTKNRDEKDLFEALRLMGTGLHILEDFPSHSNYIELALRELGVRDIFPHVGTATELSVRRHQVFPLVTGTYGTVDFLEGVLGESADPSNLSELQQLEAQFASSLQTAKNEGSQITMIKELLTTLPDGLISMSCTDGMSELEEKSNAKDFEVKARINDGDDAWDYNTENLAEQVLPFLECHDKVIRELANAMEEVPSMKDTFQQIRQAMSVFVFSLIAPFVLPVLRQVRKELAKSSSEVIASSEENQFVVFTDPYSSNPTHSMLAKDHSSNVLNEPAGKIASEVLNFVVPLIMRAWDDENKEVPPLLDYILLVFHHPVCRDENKHRGQGAMFNIVREWWEDKSDKEKDRLRRHLSMDGVKAGRNHKGHDTGHGCAANVAGAGKLPGDVTGGVLGIRMQPIEAEVAGGPAVAGPSGTNGGSVSKARAAAAAGVLSGAAIGQMDSEKEKRGSRSPSKRDREHRKKHRHHAEGSDRPSSRDRDRRHKERTDSKERRRRHRSTSRDREKSSTARVDSKLAGGILKDPSRRRPQSPRKHKDDFIHNNDPDYDEERDKTGGMKNRLSQMFSGGIGGVFSGFGGFSGNKQEPAASNEGSLNRHKSSGGYGYDGADGSRRKDRERRRDKDYVGGANSAPNTPGELPRRKSTRRRDADGNRIRDDVRDDGLAPLQDEGGLINAAGGVINTDDTPRRKSTRRRDTAEQVKSDAVGGSATDYFQPRHTEQDLVNESPLKRKSTRRKTSDRESSRRNEVDLMDDEAPSSSPRVKSSKASRLLGLGGAAAATAGVAEVERRRHKNRDRDSSPREDRDKRRKERKTEGATAPLQFDVSGDDKVSGGFPTDGPSEEKREKRHRRHRSEAVEEETYDPLAFGEVEKKKEKREHRHRERSGKSGKEVNFEDEDIGKEERADDREDSDERRERREKRKKEKKRESVSFGGYGRP